MKATTADDYKGVHGHITVQIEVHEGPQWFVNQMDLEGFPESDLSYLHAVLQSISGEPFSEANVAADRDSILSYYFNNGYPDAAFDWTQTDGPSEYRVNLTYQMKTGKREYVRSVLIRGLETTRQSLVDKRVLLQPGDPLSQSKLGATQQSCYDLGVFRR